MSDTKKLTSQYRAHITLPNETVCSITAENPNTLKEVVQRLVDGQAKFEQIDPNTILIFHPKWGRGNSPMGYINHQQVPEELSVATLLETRAAKAA